MEMEPESEPVPPEPTQAPTAELKVPEAEDRLSYQCREKAPHRSRRSEHAHPGGKAAYYLAGSIVIVLGIAVALWVHPELRWDLPSVPDNASQDVRIFSSHYARSPWGKQLYVLRGSVRDIREGATSTPIRLRARIFNANKGVLAEKTFLAGSDIPEIGIPPEIKLENTNHEEGWLPFIVIFFDPGVIADVSVTIEPL